MSADQIINFNITSMDGLGQGVSKESDKITFISKTIIGDQGKAIITKSKKNVAFAKVTKFTQLSPMRIRPECPHFDDCPSCHFLHVDYQNELSIKKDAFSRLFRKHNVNIEVIGAVRRHNYRNRIQLHYDLKSKSLGMLNMIRRNIVPIPDCLIPLEEIRAELKKLYKDNYWLTLAPKDSVKGHLEIYSINNQLKLTWNRPYADGGFTQVFQEMNQKLKNEIHNWYQNTGQTNLLDLFAGNGNLSKELNYSKRLCIDIYQELPGIDFYSQNLYANQALEKVSQIIKKNDLNPQTILIDPPRSGFKDLKTWIEKLNPENVAYISCDPNTLARDVADISRYEIKKAILLDFFPSTFHFESLLFLERKK